MKSSTLSGRIHEKLRMPVWTGGQYVHSAVRIVTSQTRSVTILRLWEMDLAGAAASTCLVQYVSLLPYAAQKRYCGGKL